MMIPITKARFAFCLSVFFKPKYTIIPPIMPRKLEVETKMGFSVAVSCVF